MNLPRIRGAFVLISLAFLWLGAGRTYAIIDLNGNGMSDIWELIYGSGLNPNADLDGTGMTNLEKSIAGLSPYNSSSVFAASVVVGSGSNLLLSWPSVNGKQYQMLGESSLASGSWANIGGSLAGTGAVMSGTVTRSGSANFFSVAVTDGYDAGEGTLSNWEALQLGIDPTNIYSNGHLSTSGSALSNYQYVVAALTATNVITVTATKNTASIPLANVAESSGTFTITRTGNLNPITVYLSVSGSAIAGRDYSSLPVSCYFPLNVDTVAIPLVPLAGSTVAPATPVTLSVIANATYQVGTSGSDTVYLYPAPTSIPALAWTQRSDWINVKNPPYNAVGNGIADDTAAIQAALNAATATIYSPLTVYIPPGVYNVSQTLLWNTGTNFQGGIVGGTIIGCGENTTLQWTGTAGGTMLYVNGANRSRYIGLTWDGRKVAGIGIDDSPVSTYGTEGGCRHQNEFFKNFTVAGINSNGGGGGGAGVPKSSSDVKVWNCLFQNCAIALDIGTLYFNDYNWYIEGCEFLSNGVSVETPDGKSMIFCDQFIGSTVADILSNTNVTQRVRRCASIGSNTFFSTGSNFERSTTPQLIMDCHIDSWKSTLGAIQLTCPGPHQVFDCVFTNPPNGNPPILMEGDTSYPGDLMVSGNYCPTITNLVSPTGTNTYGDFEVLQIPCGSYGNVLTSPSSTFLQTVWPSDAPNILDVTGSNVITGHNYGADKTGVKDSTAAIQLAINDAAAADSGWIVYLPVGVYTSGTILNVTGGNYVLQGCGISSQLVWTGGTTSAYNLMSVTSPQNITLQQFQVKTNTNSTTTAIQVTSSGSCSVTFDNVYFSGYSPSNIGAGDYFQDGGGVLLSNLPAGANVFFEQLDSSLYINNCGAAMILGKSTIFGRLVIGGAAEADTGFLGFDYFYGWQSIADASHWDVQVNDNQSVVLGDYYEEQGYNHLQLNRGAGTSPGRVAVAGFKQNSDAQSAFIDIENYAGRVYYGPTWYDNPWAQTINQSGSNPVSLITTSILYYSVMPTITVSSSCTFVQSECIYEGTGAGDIVNQSDILPSGYVRLYAQSLDDFRQLGAVDLQYRYGIGNTVLNSSAELDTINPSPLTISGYEPASWTVSGTAATASGVRNVTVTGTASPFGPGAQSFYFVDTSGTTAGSALQFSQTMTSLSATQSAVFSFDFDPDPTGTTNDLRLRAYAGASACCNVHLSGTNLSAVVNGTETPLQPVVSGTWYRVQVFMQPPAGGKSNATLNITPWTASGPGTTASYTIDGVPAGAAQGFNEVYMNEGSAGEATKIHLDNITLVSGIPFPSM